MSAAETEALKPSKKKKAPASDDGASITCEYCGDTVPTLISIDAGMRISLQANAELQTVPHAVCGGCHSILSKMISMGAVLKSQAQVKEQNRLMLWRNRVALVRKAKEFLARKEYGEAAIHYEKYLRVLELVYDKKPGELKPDLFSSESRRQEMTVVTSVLWDLMRIYDQSPRYKDRQKAAAAKLVEFVRFTPIYGYVMRKAEILTRTAKNPDVFKEFLKLSNKSRPRCFVASAAFEGAPDPTIDVLRLYRDRVLRQHPLGRRFTLFYYRHSPPIARAIDRGPEFLRVTLRFLLRQAANQAGKALSKAPRAPEHRERP
jgi:hypothetical protein